MTILGNIFKTALDTIDTLDIRFHNPYEDQQKQLEKLLKAAKDTAFGKYYNFENILKDKDTIQAFQNSVPIFDYEEINNKWWKKQQVNPDITWPGKPKYFAKTSGTTGNKSKRIPVTNDYLASVRSVGVSMIKDLVNFDFPAKLFEKEIFVLSSSSDLKMNENGFQEGEISGINVHNLPEWYDLFYRPGKEISAIDDWEKRKEKIVEKAPTWDVGALAGIPSWNLEILKAIIKKHNLQTIHDIWPDLTVYSTGGVAFETYRSSFEKVFGKPVTIIDTYLASEGFFAYTARPNTLNMKLALNHDIFYEFIPYNSLGFDKNGEVLECPKVLHLGDIKPNVDYAILVSTNAGLWRYMIGDTIRFTNIEKHEIKITGRTKFFLNVVGSQLSEEKLDDAIIKTAKEFNIDINEYTVGAVKDEYDEFYHQWILVSNDKPNETKLKEFLDNYLQSINNNYKVARRKALKKIEIKVISKKLYHDFLDHQKKKGGQIKTPKVMKEDQLKAYQKFIS